MKILVTSDLHGDTKLMSTLKERSKMADLLLVAGDITGKHFEVDDFKSLQALQKDDEKKFNKSMEALCIPYRYILGNDDWIDGHSKNILQKSEFFKGFALDPFAYVPITPFRTNREMNENMLRYHLSKIKKKENQIILAHTPPLFCGDTLYPSSRHCGSRAVREWIDENQPKFWLCGHIHEDFSCTYIGNTIVLNAACDHSASLFRAWLINTDTGEVENL